jgi:hypothetical protein
MALLGLGLHRSHYILNSLFGHYFSSFTETLNQHGHRSSINEIRFPAFSATATR